MNPHSSYCRIIRKLVKVNFGILFPVFSLNTTLKSNAMWHFAANLHGNRATILRHHPREPCAPIKLAIAGSSNSSWKPLLRSQKEKSKPREHFSVRKIYFWRLEEHFRRYFLKEWRFPLKVLLNSNFFEFSRLCCQKDRYFSLISVVYRLILSFSKDSVSKLVRLYCSNMFMKLE